MHQSTQKARLPLSEVKAELASSTSRVQQLEQDLAREQGVRATLEHQGEEAVEQRRGLQRALDEARQGFERQLDGQRAATRLADERHEADLRRALLDVDRERSSTAKLQKELEQAKRQLAEQADQLRAKVTQFQDELGSMRQKLSGSEAGFAEARAANEQLRTHLDKALARPARKVTAKRST